MEIILIALLIVFAAPIVTGIALSLILAFTTAIKAIFYKY